jgi:hypothetical protein
MEYTLQKVNIRRNCNTAFGMTSNMSKTLKLELNNKENIQILGNRGQTALEMHPRKRVWQSPTFKIKEEDSESV